MDLMLVLPHCGSVERAVRLAEQTKQGRHKKDRGALFNIARCYAQCAAASQSPARERYQELSLESLRNALTAGLKDSASLEFEPDLDPLRKLEPFKAILNKLKSTPIAKAK